MYTDWKKMQPKNQKIKGLLKELDIIDQFKFDILTYVINLENGIYHEYDEEQVKIGIRSSINSLTGRQNQYMIELKELVEDVERKANRRES